jgi:hypothetical protein
MNNFHGLSGMKGAHVHDFAFLQNKWHRLILQREILP